MKAITILLICTGNLCRSVMAEGLLLKHAEAHNLAVLTRSAGLVSGDVAAPRRVMHAMHRRGIDVARHRSQLLTPELVDEADLVLGAARAHAWEAVALRPDAIGRVFTATEVVRLGGMAGPVQRGETVDQWARRLHDHRQTLGPASVSDDIEDPLGRSRRTYERVADELDQLTGALVELLANGVADVGPLPTIHWVPPKGVSGATDPDAPSRP